MKSQRNLKRHLLKGFTYKAKKTKRLPAAATKPALTEAKVVIVRLKNQRQIEGAIKETRGGSIVLDIGGGAIGIPKKDIKRIEIPSDSETKRILESMGEGEEAPKEASASLDNKKVMR